MARRSLRTVNLNDPPHPRYVVWELTLKCDHNCTHCGSRAGDERPDELTTVESLEVVRALAAMGTKEVVVIGGEAYLHAGFLEIVAALKAAGIRPTMTTGGRGITAESARDMAKAGLALASVSFDGMETTHDLCRAAKGSFASATASLRYLNAAGISTASNTTLNRLNVGEIEQIYEHLVTNGAIGWQVQIAAAVGRAADRPDMLLQPFQLLDIMPRLAAIKREAIKIGFTLRPANNLGYFGPEETLLRSPNDPAGKQHFHGCQAGRFTMGIESNGDVKGCPSLQTSHYVGGNVRERTIQDIWDNTPELSFIRRRTVDDLWGFCRTCEFAETCMGGCSFTAHGLFNRTGNNPYCHYRARTLAKQGLRERLVPKEKAPGLPFDNGKFDLIVEPFDSPDPQPEHRERRLKVWTGP